MQLKKLFSNLPGTWHFNRVINNSAENSMSGNVVGKANFSIIDENNIYYQENGTFTTAKKCKLKVHQEYIYKYSLINNEIEKYFAKEGQQTNFFYALKFSKNNLTASAQHLCGQDIYTAEYKFLYEEFLLSFELSYKVVGPNKKYVAKTHFSLKNNLPC